MATPKKSKAKLGKSNTSGYLGVTQSKKSGKWIGQYKGKKVKGRYPSAIAAAKARDEFALATDGDKAVLNFPIK
jgi:hypothetical protein